VFILSLLTCEILKGTKPAGLPFQQAVKIEPQDRQDTGGLTFPITLLALANEVIE
jgi:hypothetical protein